MTDPEHQLDTIMTMIGEARTAIREGAMIDLIEIQGMVQEVCASIQQDPPADGSAVHEKIVTMIGNLNLLADELKQQQTETGTEVVRQAVRKIIPGSQDS